MYREPFITEVNRHLCSKDNFISQLLSEIRDTMIFMDGFSTLNFGRDTSIIAKKAFDPSVSYIPVFTNQILCSSVQTLQSIYSCVEFGNFADANVLLRKYRDDLFFYVYIHLSDINSGFYNENSCEKQKKSIEDWTHNNLSYLKFSNIISDILNSKECKVIRNKKDVTFEHLRRINDTTFIERR